MMELSLDDFEQPKNFGMSKVGQGGFGKVLALSKKDTGKTFAVKCMHKAMVVKKDQTENCLNELTILSKLDHYPFIVNLWYAFQDSTNIYMCSDLMLGGTLQRMIKAAKHLEPERIVRYAAQITLALQFLHSHNIVHRDVKPDNILIDSEDRIHLSDFNVSLIVCAGEEETKRHEDGWGTSGYRAPEVYLRKGVGHIFSCDWWSLGSVVFEMYSGFVPYNKRETDDSSTDLLMRMKSEKLDFQYITEDISQDFVRELLKFGPEERIGCQHGSNSEVIILTHPFFTSIDWDVLEKSCTEAPVQNLHHFENNFDEKLDEEERIRNLNRNLGVLGLNLFEESDDEIDEDDLLPLTPEQQQAFYGWSFNIDFKMEQQALPEYSLLQTMCTMSPENMRTWIADASSRKLRGLCSEIKSYREASMKENYEHMLAQLRNEKLLEENLRLTRKVASLQKQLGVEDKIDESTNGDEVIFFESSTELQPTAEGEDMTQIESF